MPNQPNTAGVTTARRLVADRYPQARAAWLGGSVATGTQTETSDLDITVLLSGPPAPYRHSETIDGWPVEWFVQTEESLLGFCDDDRARRRPTTMRLVGSAIVLVDADGSGLRLRHELHEMDQQGPPPISFLELENHRYAVTDLLADLTGAPSDDERLTVAAALVCAAADLLLAANGRWSGSGKWLLRELELLDSDLVTTHAAQLMRGLRGTATGDPVPLRQYVLEILATAGGPLFAGYHRGADGVDSGHDGFAAASSAPRPNWATEVVYIVDADPNWEAQGQRLCETLEALLSPWLTRQIEHVGSTAIPGLPAKPIIDLQAAVADLNDDADSVAAALSQHDWHYVTPTLDRRPWRRFFVKVDEGRRIAHLHIMTTDSARWYQQIAFRDTLRADPSITADYAALKRALAAEHADDREAYSAAKESFIHAVLDATTDYQ